MVQTPFSFLSMFSHQSFRFYLFVFLAFAVLSSKHIFIYNEETLVAASFFCFLFFILHYFGNTIKESLDERSAVIREELQNFLVLKHRTFGEMLQQHQKAERLVKSVSALDTFTKNLYPVGRLDGKKLLQNIATTRIHNKLKTGAFSHLQAQQKLQELLSQRILSSTLMAFSGSAATPGALQKRLIREMVESLVLKAQSR